MPNSRPARLHGVVNLRPVFDWAVQLVGEVAAHADARDLDLGAVDAALAKAQEADVSQALARRLLERLQRRRPRYLEQVVVVSPRFDLPVGAGELLQRPRRRCE